MMMIMREMVIITKIDDDDTKIDDDVYQNLVVTIQFSYR